MPKKTENPYWDRKGIAYGERLPKSKITAQKVTCRGDMIKRSDRNDNDKKHQWNDSNRRQ